MLDDLISVEDLSWASELMGLGTDGFAPVAGDDSRSQAMLRLDTVDFEACPGSGKTTLLVAKLAVLAKRWPYSNQGICVLSHTNAARNEIDQKLSISASGLSLMRYPHFIGTIHSFVNEFLALPWLRSKGINVRRVDTGIALKKRWALLPYKYRWALEQSGQTESCLIYNRADYGSGPIGKFGPHTPTYQAIVSARSASSEQGYFCFDEMFVWANELLDQRPEIAETLRGRFPLVFIDEAQDNSEAQSAILHRIFQSGNTPSRRQRFGDSNQAIFSKPNDTGATTDLFPGLTVHELPRSYRFGQELADIAKGFGVTPQALVGAGPSNDLGTVPKASVIFLFDEASIQTVLPRYAQYIIENFEEETIKKGIFTAVAGVHDSDEDDPVPRTMRHYMSDYDPTCARKEAAPSSLAQYLARARFQTEGSGSTDKLVNATAAALIACGELAGGSIAKISRKPPHRLLFELLGSGDARDHYIALQEFVLAHQGNIPPSIWAGEALEHMREVIRYLSGAAEAELNDDVNTFLMAPEAPAVADIEAGISNQADNIFMHPAGDPIVRIRLGSIHSVKGETHTSTLVLDSYFYGHHLSELKPWLLGDKTGGFTINKRGNKKFEGSRILGRLKLHYVAMTRPTHLLGIAMRRDAFTEAELLTLQDRGWIIVDCATAA